MAKPVWVTLNKNLGAYNEQVDVSVITYTGRVNRGGALDIVTVDGSPVASEVVDLAQDSPGLLLIPYTQSLEVGWNGGSFANVMEWATNSPSVIGGTPTAGSTWEFVYNGSIYPVATGIVFPGDPGLVGLVTGKFNVTIPASNLLADRIISMPMSTTFRSGNLTRTFYVKQTRRPAYLVLEPASLSSEANTTHTSSFTIKCNDDLVWSQVNSLPAWMTLAKSSGTGGTSNSVTVQQNDYLAARSYVLLFKQTGGDEVQKSFPVTQQGRPFYMNFTPASLELEFDDLTEQRVTVDTNPDNSWAATTSTSWISITSPPNATTGNGNFRFKVNQSNPSKSPRTGTIVCGNGTNSKSFTVTQKKLPAFVILDPTSVNVPATGQTVNIHVDCAPGIEWTAVFNKGTLNTAQITQSSGVGPGYVTIIVGNSEQETAGSGSVTVTQLTESATATITQNAGVKVYSDITITAYNYPTATAAGGTISPNYGYSQTWTWNGVAGTGGAITTGASLSFSGGRINTSNGNASVTSKGTSISNQTTFTTGTMTVSMNGKSASASAAVPQAGNYVVGLSLSGGAISYANISAGATSASPTITGSTRNFTFSSGSTTTVTPSATYGTDSPDPENWILGSVQNGFTAVNSTTGVLTATHRGTTIGPARTSGVVTRKITVRWIPTTAYNSAGTIVATASMTATCTQDENARNLSSIRIAAYAADATWVQPADWGAVPAGGGYINFRRYTTYLYTSGSTIEEKNGADGDRSGMVLYEGGGWMEAWGNGGYHVLSRGITVGVRRRGTIYWTYDGLTSNYLSLYQNENLITKLEAGVNDTSLATVHFYYTGNPIAASGGTATANGNGKATATFSSGGIAGSQSTNSWGGTLSFSRTFTMATGNGFSINTSSGNVTAGSRGATIGGVITSPVITSTLTATFVYPSSMSKPSVTSTLNGTQEVYQAQNRLLNGDLNGSNSDFKATCTLLANQLTAAGGSATFGGSASHTHTYYTQYDSGTYGPYTKTVTDSISLSMVGNGNSRFSFANSVATHSSMTTNVTTDTVTIRCTNSANSGTYHDASASVSNSVGAWVDTGITAYGTPSISIGSGLTAAGGSATVSHSVSNTMGQKRTYTSGSTDTQSVSRAGTTTIALTGNGNNRFSLSGNIISHSNMTTNVTTDTVTVTATNSGSSSKTATASASATNAVISYADISYNQFYYNQTIPYGGGTASPGGDITYKKYYSSGATGPEDHGLPPGHSQNYVWTNSKPSWGDINSSTGVVTASANSNSSTRSASITVQITYNGSAIGVEATTTVTQAAYVKPTISLTFSYNQTGGTFVIYASQAVKEQLFIDYTYNDGGGMGGDGSITMGVHQTQVSGYAGGPDYPIAGITMVNSNSSGRMDTGNAIYTWTPT
nr:MAG TPA: cellulase [Caudoviricetes sp.]